MAKPYHAALAALHLLARWFTIGRLREEAEKNLQKAKDDLRSQMATYALVGGIVLGLLNFFGDDRIKKSISRFIAKHDRQIEKAFYSVDPRGMPVKLTASGMEKQLDRLRGLEFTYLDQYQWLDDSCTRNAVVVLATKDEDAEKLKNFIVSKELAERNDLAFVVYTKGARINPVILGEFDNVTFANNHLTLVQALFVAARGIVRQAQ